MAEIKVTIGEGRVEVRNARSERKYVEYVKSRTGILTITAVVSAYRIEK